MLPSVPAAPLNELSKRQHRLFTLASCAALSGILAWQAWVRFARPQWPAADNDTWGYLHPGIAKLLGGSFEHTYGRNFVYPGWLYLLLRGAGDFRAISVAQNLLGLATGALLWVLWRQWRRWSGPARLPAWADAVLGLGLVAYFGRAASVIHYAVQIRPEGVFPFCAALDLCLLLGFAEAWFAEQRRWGRAMVRAALSVFATVIAYEIKPSFGLAAIVAMAPFGLALVGRGRKETRRARAGLLGALAAGAVVSFGLLLWPEHTLARADALNPLILPETLLTIHAGPIRDQMQADVREGVGCPFAEVPLPDAAQVLDEEIRKAGEPSQEPFATLGFSPDYLMYHRGSFCDWLGERLPLSRIPDFCFHYYWRAWRRRPGAMLANVARQLAVFYGWQCPAFRSSNNVQVRQYAQRTLGSLGRSDAAAQLPAYPPGRVYLAAVARLGESNASFRTPPLVIAADAAASVLHLPLLACFLAGMFGLRYLPPGNRPALWRSGAALGFLYAICFGNCLTVAVVHTLGAHRYSLNLLVYAAPCEAATLAWLGEFFLAWRRGRQTRPANDAADQPPGIAPAIISGS